MQNIMRNFKTPTLPESSHHNNIFLKKCFPVGFELAGDKHSLYFSTPDEERPGW